MRRTDKDYIVYLHISPTKKYYVGITCQPPEVWWGEGGNRYQYQPHIWSAICKYGWDSFQHLILHEGLSQEAACEIERDLIQKYRSNDPEFGYNLTCGGQAAPSCVWIHNDIEEVTVSKNDLHKYEAFGWKRGRLSNSNKYIHMGDVSKKVNVSDLGSYLSKGWELGRSKRDTDSTANCRRIVNWMYKGKRFLNSESLAEYLRNHGYPKIVGSTITALVKKQTSVSYPELVSEIHAVKVRKGIVYED